MTCRRSGIRVNSTLFLIPHLTSVFLSFSHVSSPFLHWNVWGVSPFAWQQFLVQAGLYHDPRFCITFPVGSSFDARWVAHIEWLPVSFDVAYNSASQSTFFCSVFFSVPIFSQRFSREDYRSPLLRILPALWVFYFHVGFFFTEVVGTFVKSLHISSRIFILRCPESLKILSSLHSSFDIWLHSTLSVSCL